MSKKERESYKALFLDLDGTLLDLDIEKFIPAYLEALSERFDDMISKESFIGHLFASTAKMVQNSDPGKINKAVFYEDFCQRIGYTYDCIKPIIDDFYEKDFPKLKCWGKEHPHAEKLLNTSRDKNLTLVLATNPIFPATAVLQRLSWGGISDECFSLITTMENMHFCKPKPEYYREIIEKLHLEPEDCLMAGNDTLEDTSASLIGIDTYLVEDFILHRGENSLPAKYSGNLRDLANFIDNLE